MIEHVSLRVTDVAKSRAFYKEALAPLGYRITQDYPDAVGFKAEGHTSFWVTSGLPKSKQPTTHIAFRVKDRDTVRRFHRAAMKAGAKDNGGPGLRKESSPTYYAAFVLDPDGHNMEAVTFVSGRKTRASPRRGSSSN